jgi:uncharacterized OB-fold protein
MCTRCASCNTVFAANRESCPQCGVANPVVLRPRAKVVAHDPEADKAKADKALAVFSLAIFAAWLWLDALFTILDRTGAM